MGDKNEKPSFNVGPSPEESGDNNFPKTDPFNPKEVEDQFEFVDGPVTEEKPEEKGDTENIQTPGSSQGAETNPQILEILDRLSKQQNIQTSGQSTQQQQQPQQQETSEQFNKKLEEKLYNGEIEEVVAMATGRRLGPVFEQMLNNVVSVKRELIKTKHEDFMGKHEGEVEQEFQRMTPQERLDPEAYTKAFQRVKANYVDEEIEDRVAREVAKRLEEYGFNDGNNNNNKQTSRTPGNIVSRATTGTSNNNSGKIKISVTPADRKEAKLYGMDPREVAMYRVMDEQGLSQI